MCTMPDDKAATPPRYSDFRRELQYLYARKDAIDALIESLEEYERYRSVPDPRLQLKTA